MAHQISPELALVDPDLAAALRSFLPEPGDCLARPSRNPAVAAGVAHGATPASPVAPEPRVVLVSAAAARPAPAALAGPAARPADQLRARTATSGWRRAGRSLAALVLLGLLAVPFLAFRSPHYGDDGGIDSPAGAVPPVVLPSTQLPASRSGSPQVRGAGETSAARVLAWPRVSEANLYNVVFVNGENRIDRWVAGTSIALPRTGAGSGAGSLVLYRWYVYPLYRKSEGFRFGKLVTQGSIRLPTGSLE